MSIEQSNVVDAIGIEKATGDVALTISDHLNWGEDEGMHLTLLQEKLNRYLQFIESGELLETYPKAKGRNVIIRVVAKYPLDNQGEPFFKKVAEIIEGAGFLLQFKLLDPDVED